MSDHARPVENIRHHRKPVLSGTLLVFAADRTGSFTLIQAALFKPHGLMGPAYLYAVLPLRGLVFDGMLKKIRRIAERVAHS